ncbi:MAG: Undecaprenyl-phosphate 4-deoxy-4-formamido-L-arabinose transferase [Ignavibacteriaceae bacterium]|nr:Undecaprenyl-phosphate 4-deoxy-4-formamido-L-arabinose transferase [Ignavibacteriaceae bacterium]
MDYLPLSAGILLFYYAAFLFRVCRGIVRIKRISGEKANDSVPYISVIIPFRNEEKNIPRLIASLTNQKYPKESFEILLINDHSDDGSVEIIQAYTGESTVTLLHLPDGVTGKKSAITYGVSHARGEIIAGTDADCVHSPEWLNTLSAAFDSTTGMVTGPVTIAEGKGIFERMQLLEHAGLSLSGAGLIGTNHPVICSGANIAYRKSLFEKINGFDAAKTLTSGDDEQLMHKMYYQEKQKVVFLFDKRCLVTTIPEKGTAEFLQQRRRWASKSLNYRIQTILMLSPLFLFFIAYIVILAAAVHDPAQYALFFLAVFLLKTAADFMVLRQGVGIYMEKLSPDVLLPAELLHPLYIIYSVLAGVFSGFTWKKRDHRK